MQVATTKMDPRIARVHYADYRDRCAGYRKKRAELAEKDRLEGGKKYRDARAKLLAMEKEDRQLLSAYKALRKGQVILHLAQVLGACGLNAQRLPNLAAAKADKKWCHLSVMGGTWDPRVGFISNDSKETSYGGKKADFIRRAHNEDVTQLTNWGWRNTNNYPQVNSAVAAIPTVPPHLRPDDLESGKYTILWEAEWKAKAPLDPMLLQQVDKSDYYVVLAQWDLTELEQQVLQGRFS